MGTADGISDSDWDHVLELAARLSDAVEGSEQEEASERDLMAYLDKLESTYGPLPSILATRADFLQDYDRKEELLTRAYAAAAKLGDRRNLVDISHSLAELYVDARVDVQQGRKWLDRLDAHLLDCPDSTYADDAQTFRQKLQQLDSSHEA
jgi:hypothetical protein